MEENNPLRSNNQNKMRPVNNRSAKPATPLLTACKQEEPSSYKLSSPDFLDKNATPSRRSNDSGVTLPNSLPEVESENSAGFPITRDEIVSRRKLKVAARKQMKKQEKLLMNKKDVVEQVEKPSFSLQLASEDFPTLDAIKIKKKSNTCCPETFVNEVERKLVSSSVINEIKSTGNKIVEKSWKPKVKDPIHIDLSQALLNKTEKNKPLLKKADPPNQRNVLTGNILDSDNPTRRKGKVRPDKVPKPSKLKSYILNERKKKLLEISESNTALCEHSELETKENDSAELRSAEESVDKTIVDTNCNYALNENITNATKHSARESENTLSKPNRSIISSSPAANIHSRRFREYCTNCLTEEIIKSVCGLLEKVAYFQDRMFVREPIKASAKRRYVAGINQVNKYLHVKKVKLLVIAPDLEKNPGKGGLDDIVETFKIEAESQGIPCVFGPNRKRLGRAVKKNTLVSCVAVISYEGAEELYSQVLEALQEGRIKYLNLTGFNEDHVLKTVEHTEESLTPGLDVTSSLLATLRKELLPADRLLSSLNQSSARAEETLKPNIDATSALLPTLRKELLPADRLLSAFHQSSARAEE